MRVIEIKNPKILNDPITFVSQEYSSGSTLYVEDSSKFANEDLILVGGVGNEKAETTDLTTAPANKTTLTITALSHGHETDESVQKVLYDQFDIQYRTSSSGSWQSLDTGKSFDWREDETTYIHQSGQEAYEYRVRYKNSATSEDSSWSDTITGSGFTRKQVGSMIEQVRKWAEDEEAQVVDDDEIIGYFNYAQDAVTSLNKRWPWLKTEQAYTTTASSEGAWDEYALPDDWDEIWRCKFRYDDGASDIDYFLAYLPQTDFEYKYKDQDADSDDNAKNYSVDEANNYLMIGPKTESAGYTITLIYFKSLADLDSYGDATEIPLPEVLINYATAKVWRRKDNFEKHDEYMRDFANSLRMLEQMNTKTHHPKVMKRYKGRKAISRMYGDRRSYSDSDRENYY